MNLRVVIDANVLVSGIGWSGPPATVVEAVLNGRVEAVTSPPLIAELRRVFAYPKIARAVPDGAGIVDLIAAASHLVEPSSPITSVRDEADNRVLEAAVAGDCAYVISGDNDLLELGRYGHIEIVTPTEFVARVSEVGTS